MATTYIQRKRCNEPECECNYYYYEDEDVPDETEICPTCECEGCDCIVLIKEVS